MTDIHRLRHFHKEFSIEKYYSFYSSKSPQVEHSVDRLNGHKAQQRIDEHLMLSTPSVNLRGSYELVSKEYDPVVITARKRLESFIRN
ncbi:MAG: hypothetical protein AB8B53_05230 [Flavobacteriales bacterium]